MRIRMEESFLAHLLTATSPPAIHHACPFGEWRLDRSEVEAISLGWKVRWVCNDAAHPVAVVV